MSSRLIHKPKSVPPDPAVLEIARQLARELARAEYGRRLANGPVPANDADKKD